MKINDVVEYHGNKRRLRRLTIYHVLKVRVFDDKMIVYQII